MCFTSNIFSLLQRDNQHLSKMTSNFYILDKWPTMRSMVKFLVNSNHFILSSTKERNIYIYVLLLISFFSAVHLLKKSYSHNTSIKYCWMHVPQYRKGAVQIFYDICLVDGTFPANDGDGEDDLPTKTSKRVSNSWRWRMTRRYCVRW